MVHSSQPTINSRARVPHLANDLDAKGNNKVVREVVGQRAPRVLVVDPISPELEVIG